MTSPSPNHRCIIFLDMDGVLLPFPNNHSDDETHDQTVLFPATTLRPLKRLWTYVGKSSSVEWVLSSTWRVHETYIRDIERALHTFGISIEFSDITDPKLHTERQWEIQDWLSRNNCCNNNDQDHTPNHNPNNQQQQQQQQQCIWLALDDEELLEGEKNANYRSLFQGHVVCTTSHLGLTEQDVDKAITLWDLQWNAIGA